MGFSCLSPLTVSVSDIIRGGNWGLDVTKYYRRCLVSSDSIRMISKYVSCNECERVF